jgi:hypothetical protein
MRFFLLSVLAALHLAATHVMAYPQPRLKVGCTYQLTTQTAPNDEKGMVAVPPLATGYLLPNQTFTMEQPNKPLSEIDPSHMVQYLFRLEQIGSSGENSTYEFKAWVQARSKKDLSVGPASEGKWRESFEFRYPDPQDKTFDPGDKSYYFPFRYVIEKKKRWLGIPYTVLKQSVRLDCTLVLMEGAPSR